jgi:hypothetical protein
MTDQEKKDHPKFHVQGGYLKVNTYEYACKVWWDSLSTNDKEIVMSIPGFDKQIFFEVTLITV